MSAARPPEGARTAARQGQGHPVGVTCLMALRWHAGRAVQRINQALAWCMRGLIRGYQLLLSPWLGHQCRFTPTCSYYALEAIDVHGPWKGGWLTLWRLLRCHPFHPGGHDPVPPLSSPPKTNVPHDS